MQATSTRPKIIVSADGAGVVSQVGSRLLADLADATSLTGELSAELALPGRARRHDPGRVLVDMAVAVAGGARTISDVAVLEHQPELFGAVASDSTCWRLLARVDPGGLAGIARARAAAREVVWAQYAEVHGRAVPAARAAGRTLPGLVIDLDASIVISHSDKESAAPTFKRSFGYHPMLAFCDNTAEFLAGRLRPGNAAANATIDHIEVLDDAIAALPEAQRYGTPILIRTDTAGASKAFLAHLRGQHQRGVQASFSLGWRVTRRERDAITALDPSDWTPAIETDGTARDGAWVAELTELLPRSGLTDYPAGTRVIVRRERPHPGAQLDAFEEADGYRYTCLATDTPGETLPFLDARHRAHARVEDRIRCAKATGLVHFPSRDFAINHAWLAVVMLAVDLIAWTQLLLLDGHLATAEPKTLRYRLLGVAARITRGGRQTRIRIHHRWPWADQLAAAFTRLQALPAPAG